MSSPLPTPRRRAPAATPRLAVTRGSGRSEASPDRTAAPVTRRATRRAPSPWRTSMVDAPERPVGTRGRAREAEGSTHQDACVAANPAGWSRRRGTSPLARPQVAPLPSAPVRALLTRGRSFANGTPRGGPGRRPSARPGGEVAEAAGRVRPLGRRPPAPAGARALVHRVTQAPAVGPRGARAGGRSLASQSAGLGKSPGPSARPVGKPSPERSPSDLVGSAARLPGWPTGAQGLRRPRGRGTEGAVGGGKFRRTVATRRTSAPGGGARVRGPRLAPLPTGAGPARLRTPAGPG